ncbi:PIN domain-containing protein [Nocardia seriolae]|uniref:Ribonuclease VapC n=1 Tax=Nocardia seriolae TaxID=37332 RepID=A0A0B8N480_9NOCA|nr:PIN domain-containing protein [Nocardia seriolae]APA94884.1 Ribonuclease VapC6 [Nocardia seriolae]MTJ60177.1 PIN domain-containing protein [Nocardia seriolae]MTJ71772.1 PIN domain-containing protein [Nocardia seriolae]MTJ85173.1 PIN domain-containing protein [Nocardia seriolae]MTK29169.1 PIN domain-containing protein [Nocardia seriolae]
MIGYLVDSSALWRILRDRALVERWLGPAAEGDLHSCYPQRAEFLRSARNLKEYSQLCGMFDTLYSDVTVPKSAGLWIAGLQHRAAEDGCHRSLSAVDLQICATAAYHGLVVVHDDADFVTAARFATELRQLNVHDGPLT